MGLGGGSGRAMEKGTMEMPRKWKLWGISAPLPQQFQKGKDFFYLRCSRCLGVKRKHNTAGRSGFASKCGNVNARFCSWCFLFHSLVVFVPGI